MSKVLIDSWSADVVEVVESRCDRIGVCLEVHRVYDDRVLALGDTLM